MALTVQRQGIVDGWESSTEWGTGGRICGKGGGLEQQKMEDCGRNRTTDLQLEEMYSKSGELIPSDMDKCQRKHHYSRLLLLNGLMLVSATVHHNCFFSTNSCTYVSFVVPKESDKSRIILHMHIAWRQCSNIVMNNAMEDIRCETI